MTKKNAKAAIEAVIQVIKDSVKSKPGIRLTGVGNFRKQYIKERNPQCEILNKCAGPRYFYLQGRYGRDEGRIILV